MHFTSARLAEILEAFPSRKILVIGDLMLDEFLWGKVTRISPEAPVPVVDIQRRAAYPGGAANVARNLASLGAQAVEEPRLAFGVERLPGFLIDADDLLLVFDLEVIVQLARDGADAGLVRGGAQRRVADAGGGDAFVP